MQIHRIDLTMIHTEVNKTCNDLHKPHDHEGNPTHIHFRHHPQQEQPTTDTEEKLNEEDKKNCFRRKMKRRCSKVGRMGLILWVQNCLLYQVVKGTLH